MSEKRFFARSGALDVLVNGTRVTIGQADANAGALRISANTKSGYFVVTKFTRHGSRRLGGFWDQKFHWCSNLAVCLSVQAVVRDLRCDDWMQTVAASLVVDAKARNPELPFSQSAPVAANHGEACNVAV